MKRALWPILLATAGLAACVHAPETGRSQLHLISNAEVENMAISSFDQMKKDTPISQDPVQNAEVRRVGTRIVQAARFSGAPLPPPEQWEFVVFNDDKTVNAFAMPGGKIGVYSGMFKVANSENELAVVLGHEVAHVAAGHGTERVSQAIGVGAVGTLLGVGLNEGKADARTQQIVMAAYGAGATLGYVLPFSRTQEAEADHIGLLYTARAGYDPHAAIGFWQKMAQQSAGSAPPEFLSDHPSDANRISALQAEMPQAVAEYQKAQYGQ